MYMPLKKNPMLKVGCFKRIKELYGRKNSNSTKSLALSHCNVHHESELDGGLYVGLGGGLDVEPYCLKQIP